MTKRIKKWWIKERYNPQLGTNWYPLGRLSKTAAMLGAKTLYGNNKMHSFDTEEEYLAKIKELGLEVRA